MTFWANTAHRATHGNVEVRECSATDRELLDSRRGDFRIEESAARIVIQPAVVRSRELQIEHAMVTMQQRRVILLVDRWQLFLCATGHHGRDDQIDIEVCDILNADFHHDFLARASHRSFRDRRDVLERLLDLRFFGPRCLGSFLGRGDGDRQADTQSDECEFVHDVPPRERTSASVQTWRGKVSSASLLVKKLNAPSSV
jgi:hypothetical protein